MIAMPEWTEKIEKRGLDPLGLQNGGVQLYQQLMPGISNVTLRMRYYGLYCWASEAYAREIGSTDESEWRRWIRRLEALYALVAVSVGGETGVAGVDWADKRLALGEAVIDFADAASNDADKIRYLTQRLGVFGGAYYSQMVEMGLFAVGQNHALPTRSDDLGLAAAKAFASAIGRRTEQLLVDTIRAGAVGRETLKHLSPIVPAAIGTDSPECAGYEALLLASGNAASMDDRSRRDTLLLILRVASALDLKPAADAVRWHLFSPANVQPAQLEPQRLRWEAYQTHDLFQVAAASLLRWAIDLIGEYAEGRSLPDLKAEIVARLADAKHSDIAWKIFRDGLAASDEQIALWSRALTSRRRTAEDKAWEAISLVAALDARVRDRSDLNAEITRSFALEGGGRTIRTELRWYAAGAERPVGELIADYVIERVVRRHSWVAMQKLRRQRDYTFLFEARDGRLVYRANYEPVATTPRLDPAIQFLVDVKLLGPAGITPLGRAKIGAIS